MTAIFTLAGSWQKYRQHLLANNAFMERALAAARGWRFER